MRAINKSDEVYLKIFAACLNKFFLWKKQIFQFRGLEHFDELPSDYKNYAGVFEFALKNIAKGSCSKIFYYF